MYGLLNPLLQLRGVYVRGYSTPCYSLEGCMYEDIQFFVTLKRGVCTVVI